ncbi:tryptophan synthase subunit alpha [Wohlfahrtiimonas chitiniclastica]|uniref:tryptophan synthase subunit alpha n=1 Tax=Wohlfahrtiimonas chitiniclastica TaxID=400946 RepID=UPI0003609F90|nr:tryptophan synthase subunit alpha [Wohlfahrtiimonas chitiniclastica]
MGRYGVKFSELKAKGEGAFIPFVMIGDPNPEDSLKIIQTLVDNGADAIELGVPFSDPMADGPIIQNAGLRAMESGTTVAKSFEVIAQVRAQYPDLPIGLLMYANLVFKPGLEQFYAKAKATGVDSVLVVDVPLNEFAPFQQAARKHDIESIFIVPPNANEATIRAVAAHAEGYIYLMSRNGTTGLGKEMDQGLPQLVALIRSVTDVPIVQGFGISTPEQVSEAIKMGADGAISGSFLVSIIERYHDNVDELLSVLASAARGLKAGTK